MTGRLDEAASQLKERSQSLQRTEGVGGHGHGQFRCEEIQSMFDEFDEDDSGFLEQPEVKVLVSQV